MHECVHVGVIGLVVYIHASGDECMTDIFRVFMYVSRCIDMNVCKHICVQVTEWVTVFDSM